MSPRLKKDFTYTLLGRFNHHCGVQRPLHAENIKSDVSNPNWWWSLLVFITNWRCQSITWTDCMSCGEIDSFSIMYGSKFKKNWYIVTAHLSEPTLIVINGYINLNFLFSKFCYIYYTVYSVHTHTHIQYYSEVQ